MFPQLSDRLKATFKGLTGRGRLNDDNIRDAMREVRIALLEADVALSVVRTFLERVRVRAAGTEVLQSLSPGQAVIKVVHDELVTLMGERNESLNLVSRPPAVILLAGLQGAGKTTSAAKLARFLQEREKKQVLLTSVDVYRPAAMEQLRQLADQVGARFHAKGHDPVAIATDALAQARVGADDVLIVDTAGRLHVDDEMMAEIAQIHAAVDPVETLFVVDSMIGQDAVNSAHAFNEALALTGVILTKADGDARGGAALSIREVTSKPIKFLGVGEAIDALEAFHPDRVASRILGMGDVVGLVEEVQRSVDEGQAQKMARKLRKGKGFDFEDFREQLVQVEQMGGLGGLIEKLPGVSDLPAAVRAQAGGGETGRLIAIINSMTPGERTFPAVIKGSRKRRIATGSGTQVQEVNRLLKQFAQMQKMMKKAKGKGGLARMMGQMKGAMPGTGNPFAR
ncbi:MAG: signal recognition particle protein [Acidiferrobacteraceae bacterium]|jgi:signal recognition particle subunit SRP54|nr:signal recognition particle protein [Acidiferrobacteraceae bacterium]MBT3640974.1 signal recognition particle protein [Acidiferrobacteraceae bacterium]MBT3770240.1 signal recognition particle protein [Acidiferrobacteraceae bacterium]MBT3972435.1 signal recognition particle protein [Acidiferrobacteraceae bacterium]MBT4394615.1 signal recognition particle protein [Acidiferrobacteraceae bacterium]